MAGNQGGPFLGTLETEIGCHTGAAILRLHPRPELNQISDKEKQPFIPSGTKQVDLWSVMCHSIEFVFEPLGDEGSVTLGIFLTCGPQFSPLPNGYNATFLMSNTNVSDTRLVLATPGRGAQKRPRHGSCSHIRGEERDMGNTPIDSRDSWERHNNQPSQLLLSWGLRTGSFRLEQTSSC